MNVLKLKVLPRRASNFLSIVFVLPSDTSISVVLKLLKHGYPFIRPGTPSSVRKLYLPLSCCRISGHRRTLVQRYSRGRPGCYRYRGWNDSGFIQSYLNNMRVGNEEL